jgi:serine/threonine protein kinase
MEGGKLIYGGLSSCVFRPNIPCKNEPISTKKITKVVFHPQKTKDMVQRELMMNQYIQKVDMYHKWAIIYEINCKAPTKNEMSTFDPEGVHDCFSNVSNRANLYGNIDNYSQMMSGLYGGLSLDAYFLEQVSPMKDFPDKFLDIMKKMKPLFRGLVEMKKNKIIHNDIKPLNLVLHNGSFKYIDFGLSAKSNDYRFFKTRCLNEYNSNRIYFHYPLDYLMFYLTNKNLDKEYSKIIKHTNKKNITRPYKTSVDTYQILTVGDHYIDQFLNIRKNIDNGSLSEKQMIEGIDVYGLGMCVPYMMEMAFGEYKTFDHILSIPVVKDFMLLFSKMINPYNNDRLSEEESKDRFLKLLKKYTKNIESKRQKTKKKKSRN